MRYSTEMASLEKRKKMLYYVKYEFKIELLKVSENINDLEHMCQALTYIRGFIYVTEVTYQFLFFRNNYLNFTTSAHHIIFSL